MTIADAVQIIGAHVAIAGSEIYRPASWSDLGGPTTSYPMSERLNPQQHRADAIAHGAAELLAWPDEYVYRIWVEGDDPGGMAGAVAALRRARR